MNGLYTDNPETHPDAPFIPSITAAELIEMDLPDLVLEPMVLQLLTEAVHMKEVQIVNCHQPGMITRAVNGESVGTIIRA